MAISNSKSITSPLVAKIDQYGDINLSPDEAIKYILRGENVDGVNISDDSELSHYKRYKNQLDREHFPEFGVYKEQNISTVAYFKKKTQHWKIPAEYLYMDILEYIISRCKTKEEIDRASLELIEFDKRNELDVLRVMVYIVDQFRKNKVVWGVGRGSSVSCFCLYVIGINKIDPIKYDIPYTDFFKDED